MYSFTQVEITDFLSRVDPTCSRCGGEGRVCEDHPELASARRMRVWGWDALRMHRRQVGSQPRQGPGRCWRVPRIPLRPSPRGHEGHSGRGFPGLRDLSAQSR